MREKLNTGHSHRLVEVTRDNIVGKTKTQSIARYNKRLLYGVIRTKDIDVDKFVMHDIFVIDVEVGKYVCTVAYSGVLIRLKDLLKQQKYPNLTLELVRQAVKGNFDHADVYINCTCPDFRYRFAYWATKYKYKYGKPERRPAKITNPYDKLGGSCKHMTAILSNKQWLKKVASLVNSIIRDYPEQIRKRLKLSPEEFVVNPSGKTFKSQGVTPPKPLKPEPVEPETDADVKEVGDNDKEDTNRKI